MRAPSTPTEPSPHPRRPRPSRPGRWRLHLSQPHQRAHLGFGTVRHAGRRRSALVWVVVLPLVLGACAVTRGSGTVVTQERTVPAFEAVDLRTAADVMMQVGEERAVSVTGEDNIVDLIRTEVVGDTLVIDTPTRRTLLPSEPVTVVVSTPSIRSVDISGSGTVVLVDVDADALALSVSGSGDVRARGSASSLVAEVSGSGSIDGSRLEASAVSVDISGSGSVTVWATTALRADISGSGSVSYLGDPAVVSDVSGSGSIQPAR